MRCVQRQTSHRASGASRSRATHYDPLGHVQPRAQAVQPTWVTRRRRLRRATPCDASTRRRPRTGGHVGYSLGTPCRRYHTHGATRREDAPRQPARDRPATDRTCGRSIAIEARAIACAATSTMGSSLTRHVDIHPRRQVGQCHLPRAALGASLSPPRLTRLGHGDVPSLCALRASPCPQTIAHMCAQRRVSKQNLRRSYARPIWTLSLSASHARAETPRWTARPPACRGCVNAPVAVHTISNVLRGTRRSIHPPMASRAFHRPTPSASQHLPSRRHV